MARMFVGLSAEERGVHLAASHCRKVIRGLVPDDAFRPEPSLHITLRFLGDVAPAKVVELHGQLFDIARNHGAMSLNVDGWGMFEGSRAIFARVSGATAELEALQQDVDAAARAIGFPAADFPFNPHITLGRVDGSPEDMDAIRAAVPQLGSAQEGFEAGLLTLYESFRNGQGPFYLRAGVYSLRRTRCRGKGISPSSPWLPALNTGSE